MGLFDSIGRKTVNCVKCGAVFEKKMLSGQNLCPECNWKRIEEEKKAMSIRLQQEGIQSYYKDMPKGFRTMPADINTIIAERNKILEKYRRSDIVTSDDIRNAYVNTNVWSDEERMVFMRRFHKSMLRSGRRMSFAEGRFIVSHRYDGVVVDFDDIFAVAIVKGSKSYSSEFTDGAYLCTMFTNNPYFPAIALVVDPNVKMGFLSTKAKFNNDVQDVIASLMGQMCRNLTYPVMWIKDMKKLVKQEKCVRGNMSFEMMNGLLSCAEGYGAPFWGIDSSMSVTMPFGVAHAITEYGYHSIKDLTDELMIDKISSNVWSNYVQICETESKNDPMWYF